jgi:hypothetical protein
MMASSRNANCLSRKLRRDSVTSPKSPDLRRVLGVRDATESLPALLAPGAGFARGPAEVGTAFGNAGAEGRIFRADFCKIVVDIELDGAIVQLFVTKQSRFEFVSHFLHV